MRRIGFILALLVAVPAAAQEANKTPLAPQQGGISAVEAILTEAPRGTRFGLLVVDAQGRTIMARDPDGRFMPGSVTKLFTTAAALALLPGTDEADVAGGAQVWLDPVAGSKTPDVRLVGRGDARMSSAPDCRQDCLASLADAVAARTRQVRHVIGDASLWPDQRWAPGMSWNNIGTSSGTAVSALNLDDNLVRVTITPTRPGQPPQVSLAGPFTLRNESRTVAADQPLTLAIERPVNGTELRIYGDIPAATAPVTRRVGIDDPARTAAWSLRRMLEARGVKVRGAERAVYRPVDGFDRAGPKPLALISAAASPAPLATLLPPPLVEDVTAINKQSQNLHAQALHRRLGLIEGTGSEEWARRTRDALFAREGLAGPGLELHDGAGMSSYNRLSPATTVDLLRWAARQPWGARYRDSLAVGGVDGTLASRFKGTPLEGKVFAKTGSLNATNALAGYLIAASGRELTFAVFANDVPEGASANPRIDAALLALAAAN